MTRLGVAAALALLSATAGCRGASVGTPRAQVVVHVDTDAPVFPQTPAQGDAAWQAPVPLFDRLRADVYPPGATDPCAACTNELAVTSEQFAARAVSFGVAPPPGQGGWVARVRLTAQQFESQDGTVDPNTTLDAYYALPVVDDGTVADVSVTLATDSVGVPSGSLDAPLAATPGVASASQVGTWPDAQRTPCTTTAPARAACVPGGAYWMGGSGDHVVPGESPTWRRLVVVSPFWIDQTEAVVADARARGLNDPDVWDGTTDGLTVDSWCTFTPAPTSRDPLPVECVSWFEAQSYCKSLGGALVSDAQFMYVAGGAQGTPYPWGQDAPTCTEAIWGRNGFGFYGSDQPQVCRAPTNFLGPMGGPEPPGHGTRDVVVVPGGARIVDLAGNVSEWLLDGHQPRETGSCWASPGVLQDPVCPAGKDVMSNVMLAPGSWSLGVSDLEAPSRTWNWAGTYDASTGFRCAYPGK